MTKCPKCNDQVNYANEWYYGPKADPMRFRCQSFKCHCGNAFIAWIRGEKTTVRNIGIIPRRKD